MSTIDEIMSAAYEYGCARADERESAGSASFQRVVDRREDLSRLIVAAIADARREGAEQMREAAARGWDGCTYDAPGETLDIGNDIRALPLPTGQRQAVLLTDEQIDHRNQREEIERLKADLSRERSAHEETRLARNRARLDGIAEARANLQPEIERLKADAAAYQLLRRGQHWSVIDGVGQTLRGEELDAAVAAVEGKRMREGGA